MEDYFQRILEYSITIFDAAGGVLRDVKKEYGWMDVLAHRGLDSDVMLSKMGIGEGIAGRVARDGYPVRLSGKAVEGLQEESRYPHLLIFPVICDGTTRCVITLFRKGDKGFDENALLLASSISGVFSMLIEAIEKIGVLKDEITMEKVLNGIYTSFISQRTIDERIKAVVLQVSSLFNNSYAEIYLFENDEPVLIASSASSHQREEGIHGFVKNILREKREMFLKDEVSNRGILLKKFGILGKDGFIVIYGKTVDIEGRIRYLQVIPEIINKLLSEEEEKAEKLAIESEYIIKEGLGMLSLREPEVICKKFAALSMELCSSGITIIRVFNQEKKTFDVLQINGIFDDDLSKRVIEIEERYFRGAIDKCVPLFIKELPDNEGMEIPIKSIMVFPLKVKDRIFGALSTINRISFDSIIPKPFSEDDFKRICTLSEYVSKAFEVSMEIRRLKEFVMIDERTGLPNRRFFEARAIEEINRCVRFFRRITVILVDVDIDERDERLHEIVKIIGQDLRKSIRSYDVISSMDEGKIAFLILEPLDGEMVIIERLMDTMRKKGWEYLGKEKRFLIRMGWASFPRDGGSLKHLINSACVRIQEFSIN